MAQSTLFSMEPWEVHSSRGYTIVLRAVSEKGHLLDRKTGAVILSEYGNGNQADSPAKVVTALPHHMRLRCRAER